MTSATGDIALRDFVDSDAGPLFEWMRDPESVRMAAFTTARPDDREEFNRWLSRNRSNPDVIMKSIWVSAELWVRSRPSPSRVIAR